MASSNSILNSFFEHGLLELTPEFQGYLREANDKLSLLAIDEESGRLQIRTGGYIDQRGRKK